MTNPTPPASPTSARNVPTNLDVLGARLQVIRDTDPPMSIIALNQLIDEIDQARKTYRPPSPPAVVGKPTSKNLANIMFDANHAFLAGQLPYKDARDSWAFIADALLAAPIWPTAEPPATVDADEYISGVVHELKTWPSYFQNIIDGFKTFEIRKDDRNFNHGDELWLREYDPHAMGGPQYTGRSVRRVVSYVLSWRIFDGLAPGHVCMGLRQRIGSGITREEWDAEALAKCMYDAVHKGLKNCWEWGDPDLDIEHPGTRARFLRQAKAVHALISGKKG